MFVIILASSCVLLHAPSIPYFFYLITIKILGKVYNTLKLLIICFSPCFLLVYSHFKWFRFKIFVYVCNLYRAGSTGMISILFPGLVGSWCSSDRLESLLASGRKISTRSLIPCSDRPGLFTCTACGKVYQWKKTLLRHVRHECGKEPQFQCPYCPQRTTQKNSLKNHIRARHNLNITAL